MKTVVILAMHGAIPSDLPRHDIAEFMSLHSRFGQSDEQQDKTLKARHHELDEKIRAWPRTELNDPFYTASQNLANHLERITGNDVILAFNEFCNPDVGKALDEAVLREASRIIVVTTMMTPGGQHSETDIRSAIDRAIARHPGVDIRYAWPFKVNDVAQFLANHIAEFE